MDRRISLLATNTNSRDRICRVIPTPLKIQQLQHSPHRSQTRRETELGPRDMALHAVGPIRLYLP